MPSSDTQFKPGQSGNPTGRPKGAVSLKTEMYRYFAKNPHDAEKVISSMVKYANDGDARYTKLLMEYIDGKPTVHVDHTTQGERINPAFNISVVDEETAENIKKLKCENVNP